jgi:hypothetical protein
MSYIRCLSNPEGLYVWHDVDGTVHLHYGGRKKPKSPLSKGTEMRVPYRTFVRAVERWEASGEDRTSVHGFEIEELHVYLKTGKRVPDFKSNEDAIRYLKDARKNPSEYKIRVSYGGSFIHLWSVTWQYVVNNVMEREMKRHRARRKAKK